MLRIDFLYWQDCPSHVETWERLQAVLRHEGLQADIHRIEIKTDEEAAQFGFPGSPTLRINGRDIDADGASDQRVGLSCRIYHDASGRVVPLPSEALILKALEKENQEGEDS